mgnify:CR=1 FL=1
MDLYGINDNMMIQRTALSQTTYNALLGGNGKGNC